MDALEHEELPTAEAEDLERGDWLDKERWVEVAGTLRQIFRLALLTWSLLCLFCSVRLCLSARGPDLSALLTNLFIGFAAWFLACRIGAAGWSPTHEENGGRAG